VWRGRGQAGPPESFTFHDLRHTCATLLLMGGADVRTVAAHLGHADPTAVLRVYGHVLPAMRLRAVGVMEGVPRGGSEADLGSIAVENAARAVSSPPPCVPRLDNVSDHSYF
jgi:hypothetical protein